ncbi:MAG: serine/threonine protein kinase, partial [Okeania sp. SIO2D1]|nr:serine/threonine protein kinase [Okeania sp. SIO2D1]
GGTGETAFTNISIGTSGFAPPEQMALRPVYASDIYALGVTCIFLLTGKTPNSLGYDQINGEILWRPLVNISDWFGEILEKMLEVSVRHRFQSAEELLTALKKKESDKKQVEPTPDNSLNTVFREESTVFHDNEKDFSWMSPNTQVAQKIRERKTRLERNPATRSRPQMKMRKEVTKGYLTTVSPKKTTALNSQTSDKWTAATLRSAYAKGRRDFADCNLSRLNLRNAKLSGVNFYGANLYQSDLQGADLSDANLGHVNLTNTVLKNANLTKAYLSTASLAGCDLRDADLTNAYLNGANLRGANLCGTNLTNAMINDKQIDMAKTNWWTIMPNGKRGSGF